MFLHLVYYLLFVLPPSKLAMRHFFHCLSSFALSICICVPSTCIIVLVLLCSDLLVIIALWCMPVSLQKTMGSRWLTRFGINILTTALTTELEWSQVAPKWKFVTIIVTRTQIEYSPVKQAFYCVPIKRIANKLNCTEPQVKHVRSKMKSC